MAEMSMSAKIVLIGVFLLTGSINTLTKKWQYQSCGPTTYWETHTPTAKDISDNKDCKQPDPQNPTLKHFHKPWTQNIQMFIGEALVLILFCARRPARAREAREIGEEVKKAPFYIFLLPACCDILGTGVGGVGMLFISASVWQMMRGSLMIFAAMWSVIFLKKKLPCYNWLAVGISTVGLFLVGLSAILDADPDDASSSNVPLGILLTVISQMFAAAQMVVEELYVKGYGAPPEQVVGSEGIWGITMMIIILFVMYWIPGSDAGSYENAVDSVHVMFGSSQILIFVAFYLVSIALFNFCGVTIAGKLSTVTRTINDALRTMIIWTVEIFVYYCISQEFGSKWAAHSWVQLIGFILLILGTLVKNAVVKVPGFNYDEEAKPLSTSTAGVSLVDENQNQPALLQTNGNAVQPA